MLSSLRLAQQLFGFIPLLYLYIHPYFYIHFHSPHSSVIQSFHFYSLTHSSSPAFSVSPQSRCLL